MEHEEYKSIVYDGEAAVLFIHGILGTPNHFQKFLPLVPDDYSVHNLLLDGHGKEVKDFSGTSMKKWEAQVASAIEDLAATHKRVYVVAHSMGTLLALEESIRNGKISGLFLLAVPVKLFLRPQMFSNMYKVFFNRFKPGDRYAEASRDAYGIGPDKNIFHYIGWIPRYLELFGKIQRTCKILGDVKIPCRIYQSENDEMVSVKSVRLLKKIPRVQLTVLQESGHYYYEDNDFELLLRELESFLKENNKWNLY